MKTAVVTGAAGFIGRHLVPLLSNYTVYCYDPAFPSRTLVRVDKNVHEYGITFQEAVACGSVPPASDLFVHLAAHIQNLDTRMRGGVEMLQDIELDLAVARFIQKHHPREAFVAMSSCALDFLDDPYCWCKLTWERACQLLYKRGVPVIMLRPFSGYGHDQSPEYPFPAILKRAMQREDPLVVWGNGTQVRDFIHIDDLVQAIMHGILHFPRGTPVELGTGIGTSMYELAVMMADEVGYAPQILCDHDMPSSSPRRVANTALAGRHGFHATTSLRDGIRKAIRGLQ